MRIGVWRPDDRDCPGRVSEEQCQWWWIALPTRHALSRAPPVSAGSGQVIWQTASGQTGVSVVLRSAKRVGLGRSPDASGGRLRSQ
jgi:hypothetical protein